MKKILGLMIVGFLMGGLTSCEKELFEDDNSHFIEEENSGTSAGAMLNSGCDIYINGSFENGEGGTAAFQKDKVDRWGAAYGTGDSWDDYDGTFPYSGNKLGHMQRYKGNAEHYESVFLKMPLKTKNRYDLDYRMQGGDLRMEVYVFDEVEPVDINSITPNYIDDLNGPGFIRVGLAFASGDSWKLRTHSFSSRSGNLVFIPQSAILDNPNRMLLDKVQLTCEYGYLDAIYADIIQSTQYGYDYKFDAEISENNPNLSYLWTFNYLTGGFSSTSKSPVVNFPYPFAKPYKVEACLTVTDIDGCCVEECIIFEIASEVNPPPPPADSICNYSMCLETWLLSCGDNAEVNISTPEGWQSVTFYNEYKDILDKKVNDIVTDKGYDEVNTKIIQTDDCKILYVVECSPVPISIPYACINKLSSPTENSKQQLKLAIFDSNCDVDCD